MFGIYTLINLIFGFIQLILGLRIVLRLLAANESSPFVNWILNLSESLMTPFRGIFPAQAFGAGALDWAALIALIVYAVIAYFIKLILLRFDTSTIRSRRTQVIEEV